MITPAKQLRQAADAVARLGCSSADLEALPDAAALAGQRQIAEARRVIETYAAWMAATLARRSSPELGHAGLAAQQGFLSPEALIQSVTGSSKNEAYKLVAVGTLLAQTEAADRAAGGFTGVSGMPGSPGSAEAPGLPGSAEVSGGFSSSPGVAPWQAPIARAVAAGSLSVEAAESLRKGLGDIDIAVTAEKLATALAGLLAGSVALNADECYKRARRLRDELDEAGIAAREKQAYDDRYLRIYKLRDGKVRLNGLFAPEDGEFVLSTYDAITGPRRGGVRFVDPDRAKWAQRIQADPRSTEQLAADSFVQLLKIAGEVDPGIMLGGRRPAVRIIVTQKDLAAQKDRSTQHAPTNTQPVPLVQLAPVVEPVPVVELVPTTLSRPATTPTVELTPPAAPVRPGVDPLALGHPSGHGYLEGNLTPLSLATVERQLCDTGYRGILFNNAGQPLDVGRELRLYTERQRAAMGVRDGGCIWPGCDRPPSWTEAHHIRQWAADHGPTDIADGVCLCRAHHLQLHNLGWTIIRDNSTYWLQPPTSIDPEQTLIALHRKASLKFENRR